MTEIAIKVIYIDDTCKITDSCIIIRKYYFPLATSRTITFDQIQKISLQQSFENKHKWGPSFNNLNTWFPFDSARKNKDKFIAIHLKGKNIVPCFNPIDAHKAYNLLRQQVEKQSSMYRIQFTQNLEQMRSKQNQKPQKKLSFNESQDEVFAQPLKESKRHNRIRNL